MMLKKVLFCATVDIHFKAFHLPYLKWFKEQGWEVHVAASGDLTLPFVDKKFNIPIQRSPFQKVNLRAYKELKNIIGENHYRIIHSHTPIGGVLTRLAAKGSRKQGTKVIYTAHGFHFCKGAPLINWALYYPVEKLLSRYTDCLITINEEDFQLAKEHKFKSEHIKHIHGVGVDTEIYFPATQLQKYALRAERGYRQEDFLMFYAAEFNENKNQQFLIRSLSLIKNQLPNVKLLLAGDGQTLENCRNLSNTLGVNDRVHFLGYRNDINYLLKMSDVALASSIREGLPVNIMEAMASGLPVIASDNRGHRELIQSGKNGWLVDLKNPELMSEFIGKLYLNGDLRLEFGRNSLKIIKDQYDLEKVLKEKVDLYSMYMGDKEEFVWAIQ